MTKAKPIPDGYHTATPYLFINNAARAIEFYKQAFGAIEMMREPLEPHDSGRLEGGPRIDGAVGFQELRRMHGAVADEGLDGFIDCPRIEVT